MPLEPILNLVELLVTSFILKLPLPFSIAKSESLFESVSFICGKVDVTVSSLNPPVPVVTMF